MTGKKEVIEMTICRKCRKDGNTQLSFLTTRVCEVCERKTIKKASSGWSSGW